MSERRQHQVDIPAELAGSRLDQALSALFPDYSRSRLQQWIKQGAVTVDGRSARPRDPVFGGERVVIEAELEAVSAVAPQEIPLQIVFEDADLLVLDKPPGLVVHPAAGNWDGTLQNALLHHAPALAQLPRSGIVHRLDKDTSGLLVVAKTIEAHTHLVAAMQAREIKREYLALVQGPVISGGTIEGDIGRHPVDRKRMAVVHAGKPAVTHYRVEERFRAHTLLRVILETGRTHQIRVHLAHIHLPIIGDPVYGGRLKLPRAASAELIAALRGFRRQALHAARLSLEHPRNGEPLSFEAPLPADMAALLAALRADTHEQADA